MGRRPHVRFQSFSLAVRKVSISSYSSYTSAEAFQAITDPHIVDFEYRFTGGYSMSTRSYGLQEGALYTAEAPDAEHDELLQAIFENEMDEFEALVAEHITSGTGILETLFVVRVSDVDKEVHRWGLDPHDDRTGSGIFPYSLVRA